MRAPQSVLITGASGGIGSALANAYAAPGRRLILHGRNVERLAAVGEACRSCGAAVQTKALDVRDLAALREWLKGLEVDLAIVNAGVSASVRRGADSELWNEFEQVLDVNIRGALATVHALVPGMCRRGAGQIALMSSLSAYYGVPLTPAYSASKAALKIYAQSLRARLAPRGVQVNVVLPGFVKTPMSDRFPGPKPFMLSPEEAAARIVRGLARDQARISFPFPLDFGTRLLSVLPAAISQRILRLTGFGG